MTQRYAAETTVDSSRSRAEIERILVRYGADQFAYGWSGETSNVGFRIKGRFVRLNVTMPAREKYRLTSQGRPRTQSSWDAEHEQACRQIWRALALVIKAKLEAAEAGISTIEAEFMAHTVLPSGETVGDFMEPQIQRAYELGVSPQLLALPAPKGGRPQ